jgi:hypothetical protein
VTSSATRRGWLPLTAAGLSVAVGLSACSGEQPEAPSTTSSAPSPTTRADGLSPLQGGPVLAVKIDNTASSRPRVGLNQADVVYVEPVEGGLNRLLAVFSRKLPKEVGPVRSARETDIDIVAPFGPVAFAYSGASRYTLARLPHGKQVNLSFDAGVRGFHRDSSRRAPYNVIGNPAELIKSAKGSAKPKDIGYRYGAAAKGGTKATRATATWRAARMEFSYNAKRGQYLVTTDGVKDVGADGTQHGAATVVLQRVKSHLSANRDVNGMATPILELTGSGKATVLRDGKAWTASWKRTGASSPTTFTAGGKPVAFSPTGPVWVVLVASGVATAVR